MDIAIALFILFLVFGAPIIWKLTEKPVEINHPLIQKFEMKYSVAGKYISCPTCGEDNFKSGKVQLNTSIASFFGFDWANRSGTTLTCINCGQVQWFAQKPSKE